MPSAPTQTTGASTANASTPIRFLGVSKSFDSQHVLRGVDLSLRAGACTVIIGESGAGKSVILKHMVGLLRPDSGQVWFKDQRIDDMPDRRLVAVRRQFGFLFQMGALFDSLSVEQNVAFPLREHTRLGRAEIARRVKEKLDLVGLDGTQQKKPAELSGGQKKRVALARAIALDPQIILYDEPTTGLDPIRADIINQLIRKLQAQLGVTSVVVTHDMDSVRTVGDRVIMLYDGRFIFDGTPAALEASDDPRVSNFVRGTAPQGAQ